MVEIQSCELCAQFLALLSSGLGMEVKAFALPKALKFNLS
jgi:hypothetical protein